MTLYFAYGDLLDSGVLRGRLGIPAGGNMPTPIAPAKLTQHKLLFRRLIAADARTFPDVAPDPSATIYGALLDLTDAQVAVLEAAPAPNMYRRLQSDVTPYLPQRGPVQVGGVVVRHEQKVTAILHEAVNKTADVAQPTRQQMRAILDGALASELPLLWSRSLIGSFGQLSCVDDISTEKCDGAGEPITKVYTKAASLYAVYETDRVKVQYADDMERADQQRKNMAELNELRGQIAGLIDGWQTAKRRRSPLPAWLRTGDAENHDAKPDPRVKKYNSRVAAGLIMCLEGDAKGARSTLQGVQRHPGRPRIAWPLSISERRLLDVRPHRRSVLPLPAYALEPVLQIPRRYHSADACRARGRGRRLLFGGDGPDGTDHQDRSASARQSSRRRPADHDRHHSGRRARVAAAEQIHCYPRGGKRPHRTD